MCLGIAAVHHIAGEWSRQSGLYVRHWSRKRFKQGSRCQPSKG
jgi:hypothetical protein